MFNILPLSLIIASLGAMLYIAVRHLRDIEETDKDDGLISSGFFDNLASRVPWDSIKTQTTLIAEKSLHKTRLLLLRADNALMGLIGKIRKNGVNGDGNGKEIKSDNFWQDIAAQKNNENPVVLVDQASTGIKSAGVFEDRNNISKKSPRKKKNKLSLR